MEEKNAFQELPIKHFLSIDQILSIFPFKEKRDILQAK